MASVADHFDLDHLAELKAVMEDDFDTLVMTFVNDTRARLEKLRLALEEVEINGVREIAHSLKGSAINMGATELASLCRQMEDKGRDRSLEGGDELLHRMFEEFVACEAVLQPHIER